PVSSAHEAHAEQVAATLAAARVRVDVVGATEGLGKRIRAAKMEKLPYVLVVGDDDVAAGTVGVNPRGGEVERGVPLEMFMKRISEELDPVVPAPTLA
ncbi:MAG: His/Gly/Thr/Pro-type tRNA ligase C-terminal domain-containing protein, partial [Actinomycetota bacterium]|nr:His/Gly/Thr/Pro-type tRNA ligase C-terminal domain-containing protein [Actinomycetota bacterium]